MQDNGVRTQIVKLSQTNPHPENYNQHDESQIGRLRGSQIIAGEKTGRRVFAIEKQPAFVAATLERWHIATNQTPTLIDG